MPKAFESKFGKIYNLNKVSAKEERHISDLMGQYRILAQEMSHNHNKSVFYFLKSIESGTVFFFLVPVDADEVLDLNYKYGEEYLIGVYHCEHEQDYEVLNQRRQKIIQNENHSIDNMPGKEFEKLCADILHFNGYSDAKRTPYSGDHGIDIIAYKDGKRYAVQCKRYKGNVGFAAIQEVFTGRALFHADYAIIMTNSYFTRQAIEDAKRLEVDLWDRDRVINMLKTATENE